MQAAGAEVITSNTGLRAVCGPHGVKAFTVDVNTPYGPRQGHHVLSPPDWTDLLAAREAQTPARTFRRPRFHR